MNKTKIKWCDYTVNPVKGLCPVACPYCYARAMYKRFKWNPTIRFEPEALLDLATVPEGSRVFIGSTMELFHEYTKQWMPYILNCIKKAPWQTSILVTKQPQNLIKFSPFPDNCWVGVTATDYDMFVDACGHLGALKHGDKIKTAFVSIEPLLSWDSTPEFTQSWLQHGEINQVIIGSQTKPYKPPKIEWVQEIVQACDKAGIPVFLKDNLYDIFMAAPHSDLFWEDMSHLRQELPGGRKEYG